MDDQVDGFEQDSMVGIVLVHIVAYLGVRDDFHEHLIDYLQQLFILRRAEKLEDLEGLDLQPGGGGSVVQVVCGKVVDLVEQADDLGHEAFKAFLALSHDGAVNEVAGCKE